jgi:hypothetical protein
MQTRLSLRLWWILVESAFDEILKSGGRFYVGAFGRSLASVALKMAAYNSVVKEFVCY